MAYEFHYTPTGTGVISGKEVLEQTEDAINDLGNTAISGVQEALDKAEQALTNSANAVDDAQTALNTANNAEGVAIQAQNDVSNLSGTVANIGNRVTTAEGNIGNLQGRMTTAEGNITNLQGRMTTAEGNIGNLQTAVSTAQATANSAQQTATTARQQSYVFRYSSTTLVASSTNSNTLLDNTDNLKVGDKVIDSSGVLFSITAIDTANSTFTIGTALIDLAQDSDVVHKSGDETIAGIKTFNDGARIYKSNSSENTPSIILRTSKVSRGSTTDGGDSQSIMFNDRVDSLLSSVRCTKVSNGTTQLRNIVITTDTSNNTITCETQLNIAKNGDKSFVPSENSQVNLGSSSFGWKSVYATNYYYGSNNVEFSTKFVTTDTNQTISGNKTFSSNVNVYNSDSTASTPNLTLRSSKSAMGTSDTDVQTIYFSDKNGTSLASVKAQNFTANGATYLQNTVNTKDTNNQVITASTSLYILNNGRKVLRPDVDNDVLLGYSNNRWKDVNTYLVNGLEPSSLSLPSDRSASIDISSYFTNTSSGDINTYTAPSNGWIYLSLNNITSINLFSQTTGGLTNYADYRGRMSDGGLLCLFPIRKGDGFKSQWFTSSSVTITTARFIPCQGNV